MDTKTKIKKQAIQSFNKSGYASVSLFELAQILKISRGNLTYHYKDKETLLRAILEDMWNAIEELRSKSRSLPSFENLHNEVQLYFKFQKSYAFVFGDSQMLKIPFINKKFKEMTAQTILDNKAAIAFSIQSGNMKSEPFPGVYNNIATTVWMIAFHWISQTMIVKSNKSTQGEKMIWSLLIPHFTDKGIESFKKYFGEEYFNSLGNAFDKKLESYFVF